jgi:hypothetical protein
MDRDTQKRIVDAQKETEAQTKVMDLLSQLPNRAAIERVLMALRHILAAESYVPGIMEKLSAPCKTE